LQVRQVALLLSPRRGWASYAENRIAVEADRNVDASELRVVWHEHHCPPLGTSGDATNLCALKPSCNEQSVALDGVAIQDKAKAQDRDKQKRPDCDEKKRARHEPDRLSATMHFVAGAEVDRRGQPAPAVQDRDSVQPAAPIIAKPIHARIRLRVYRHAALFMGFSSVPGRSEQQEEVFPGASKHGSYRQRSTIVRDAALVNLVVTVRAAVAVIFAL
jgi:hypothetical protein